jgi:molybdopterin synthase sulfur carrier subunit
MSNNMISVIVKFFATLREFGPAEEKITLPAKSNIESIFERYKIPKDNRKAIIMVNGRPHQDQETILEEGDIIAIFPPIGGG